MALRQNLALNAADSRSLMVASRSSSRPKKARKTTARRAEPVKARAPESFAVILAAAGVLLAEMGVEGFTTKLLAARAGVHVRTVTSLFPDKWSALLTLAERQAAERRGWLEEHFRSLVTMERPAPDLQQRGLRCESGKTAAQSRIQMGAGRSIVTSTLTP